MMALRLRKRSASVTCKKRVGTALRKLKSENTGLGGKGKLTNATTDNFRTIVALP